MTQQENTYPPGTSPASTFLTQGGVLTWQDPPEVVLPTLCFPRRLPPPGHTALTFLPSHDLDSFPSSPEISRSLATPGSPTLNLAPRQPSGGVGSAGTGSSPRQTRALHSRGTGLPRVVQGPVLFLLPCWRECHPRLPSLCRPCPSSAPPGGRPPCPGPGPSAAKSAVAPSASQLSLSLSSHCSLVPHPPFRQYVSWGGDQSQPEIYLISIWPGNELPLPKTNTHGNGWKPSHLPQ